MSMIGGVKDIIRRLIGEVPTKTLVKRGLKVGTGFNRQQGCYIDPTHCYLIEIGDDVTMSIRVTLMAHDASTKKLIGKTKIGHIKIGSHVFIGANATILPGITIGDYAVVGAGSVVTHDVPEGVVVAGVPARQIGTVEELAQKAKAEMRAGKNVFDASYRMGKGLNQEKRMELCRAVMNGNAYID